MERRRRVCAAGRAADRDPAAGAHRLKRPVPGRPRARHARRRCRLRSPLVAALTASTTSPSAWLTVASAPSFRAQGELVVARRRDDRVRAERLRDLEGRRRDAAADPPEKHPLVRLDRRLRHQHPVGGLEDERKGRRLLEDLAWWNGWTFFSGIATSSACVPSMCSPTTVIRPSPWSRPGLMTTRSPLSRVPAPSAPRCAVWARKGVPGAPRGRGGSATPPAGGRGLRLPAALGREHLRSGARPARRPREYGLPSPGPIVTCACVRGRPVCSLS